MKWRCEACGVTWDSEDDPVGYLSRDEHPAHCGQPMVSVERAKRWIGPKPKECDVCQESLIAGWFDCKTKMGPWGNLCPACFERFGVGVGDGLGQAYDADGVKIAG